MQNLRKNKNKVITTQMMNLTNEEAIDTETCDEGEMVVFSSFSPLSAS